MVRLKTSDFARWWTYGLLRSSTSCLRFSLKTRIGYTPGTIQPWAFGACHASIFKNYSTNLRSGTLAADAGSRFGMDAGYWQSRGEEVQELLDVVRRLAEDESL